MNKRERTINQALIHHNPAQGPTLASERAFHQLKKNRFCMYVYVCPHTRMCVRMFMCVCIHIYIHLYIYKQQELTGSLEVLSLETFFHKIMISLILSKQRVFPVKQRWGRNWNLGLPKGALSLLALVSHSLAGSPQTSSHPFCLHWETCFGPLSPGTSQGFTKSWQL